MTYRDGPLCINSFYLSLHDYNFTRTYVKGQLVLAHAVKSDALHGSDCSSASLSSPEGTAHRSPWIGESQMARLGDSGNTPAGLTGAFSATASAIRHPMVAMNPAPCTCLEMARTWLMTFVTHCVSGTAAAVPFIPPLRLPAMTHHACSPKDTHSR